MDLDKCYENTVADLDICIAKSMDTNACLAEANFDSKRRDFHRFLHRMSQNLQASREDADKFEQQFKQFVLQWLDVFSECSIDPVAKPLQVVSADDLEACKKASELAAYVAGRVKDSEVKIVSRQREKDQEDISKCRSMWKTMKSLHKSAFKKKDKMLNDQEESRDIENPKDGVPPMPKHGWVHFGKNADISMVRDDDGMWPIVINLRCMKILLLSQQHIQLMIAFFLGFPIFFLEIDLALQRGAVQRSLPYALAVEVIICMVCIAFVLYEFVDIDVVQQLEQEVQDLEAAQIRVEFKRQQMKRFYEKAQQVSDLWLNRTIPRMELMKQFHGEIEDSSHDELFALLFAINAEMGKLERSLPPLHTWENETPLGHAKKSQLGNMIMELTRVDKVKDILSTKLPEVSKMIAMETEKMAPHFAPA